MGEVPYDPEYIARYFDEYGEKEWERFDATPMDRVGLEVHLRLLREHVRKGDRVLDAGAGPGRFTLELARLGGHVCRLYRWSDLEALLAGHPCRIVTASAANFLSVNNDLWDDRFLDVEVAACREPGALDGGTHIIAVVERTGRKD